VYKLLDREEPAVGNKRVNNTMKCALVNLARVKIQIQFTFSCYMTVSSRG
jgi:hypothetical protein